jgi:hypothetical protein
MGKTYLASDPTYFSTAPPALKYAQIGAEAMGYRNAIFRMGSDDAEDAPAVVMLYLPPGAVLPRHAHDCHRIEVVVQGAMLTEDGQWLNPGDVRTSEPGEAYGPHTAGPRGVLSVEVFSNGGGVDAAFPTDLPPEHQENLARAGAAVRAWLQAKKPS